MGVSWCALQRRRQQRQGRLGRGEGQLVLLEIALQGKGSRESGIRVVILKWPGEHYSGYHSRMSLIVAMGWCVSVG